MNEVIELLNQNQIQLLKLKEIDNVTFNSLISSNQECIERLKNLKP